MSPLLSLVPQWQTCVHCETPITLNLSQTDESLLIGRSRESGITDGKCSRQQMRIQFVDHIRHVIQISVCGRNSSTYISAHSGRVTTINPGEKVDFHVSAGDRLVPVCGSDQCYDLVGASLPEARNPQPKRPRLTLSGLELTKLNRGRLNFEWFNDLDRKVYVGQHCKSVHSSKIAAFDMDGTLITTASGKRFPTHAGDWRFFSPQVVNKLQVLHADGFKVAVLTNQAGLHSGQSQFADIADKLENISKRILVPLTVVIAASNHGNVYRKPRPGMWTLLTTQFNGGIEPDMDASFFVGDAAGRTNVSAIQKTKSKLQSDHSAADRKFALNVGLKFFTPEVYFLGRSAKNEVYADFEFDPKSLPSHNSLPVVVGSDEQQVYMMIGLPGSGKSTFVSNFHRHHPDVEVISNDLHLGGQSKTDSLLRSALTVGKSVIVDNTHVDVASRKSAILAAKSKLCKVKALVMQLQSDGHARHNCCFRELTDVSAAAKPISTVVFNTLRKRFEYPTLDEGFDEVIEIPFVANFADDTSRQLYNMFLLDK